MKKLLMIVAFVVVIGWLFLNDNGYAPVVQVTPVPSADLETALKAAATREVAAQETAEYYRQAQASTATEQHAQTGEAFVATNDAAMEASQAKTEAVANTQLARELEEQEWTATAAARNDESTRVAAVAQGTATARWVETESFNMAMIRGTDDQAKMNAVHTAQAAEAGIAEEGLKRERIKTEREEFVKYVTAGAPFVLLAVMVGLVAYKLREDSRLKVAQRGADGSAPVTILDGKVINVDISADPVIDPHKPMWRPDAVQLRVVENHQKVEAIRGLALGGRGGSAVRLAGEVGQQNAMVATGAPAVEEVLPEIAPWESLANWHGGSLPLGVGLGRVGILVHPDKVPHLLIAGTSGSGKTMEGLRPLVALGLADGWQVVLMNDAAGDFAPLKGHPNLVAIRGETEEIARVLEGVAAEIERRSALMEEAGASTWWRMANAREALGPKLMIVIDELVALACTATGTLSGRIWRAAIKITSKGRKLGMMFVAATTDPTYRTLAQPGLIVRDNCGRIVFRVRDASVSRAALDADGAERLGEHQFIAQLDQSPVKGVAFYPSDEQLRAFVQARPVMALPEPAWLKLPAGPVAAEWAEEVVELGRRIEGLWLRGSSKRKMAEAAGGVYAGAFAGKIDKALEYLAATGEPGATTTAVPDATSGQTA